ncbi:WhiB family transcriptional regulator [Actinomadura viridis]|uniref:WhiB family transcriptional regulator n=1 Tax=Actinomadura viridis TaxID=58110 RepID=UPI0036B71379
MTRKPELAEPRRAAVDWTWQDKANCRGMDLKLFFGPEGERSQDRVAREKRAKLVCSGCPVRTKCLDAAMAEAPQHGVWGGLDADERAAERKRRMRRERGRAA